MFKIKILKACVTPSHVTCVSLLLSMISVLIIKCIVIYIYSSIYNYILHTYILYYIYCSIYNIYFIIYCSIYNKIENK